MPLSGYSAADGKTNSPTLFATARLEQALGDVATASLLLALLVTLLAGAVVAGEPPAAAGHAGRARARAARLHGDLRRRRLLQPRERGADAHRRARPEPVLRGHVRERRRGDAPVTRSSERGVASEYLFWNRSLDAVYLLPGAEPPDSFAVTRLTIADDGTLLAGGRPVTRPLAADAFSDTVGFHDSDEIASAPAFRLVASPGPQRLALYVPGRFADGWLGLRGSFQLWPETSAGALTFDLTGPEGSPPVAVELTPPGLPAREVIVAAGRRRAR